MTERKFIDFVTDRFGYINLVTPLGEPVIVGHPRYLSPSLFSRLYASMLDKWAAPRMITWGETVMTGLPTLDDYVDNGQYFSITDQASVEAFNEAREKAVQGTNDFLQDWVNLIKSVNAAAEWGEQYRIIIGLVVKDTRRNEDRAPFHNELEGDYSVKPEIVRVGGWLHEFGGLGAMQAMYHFVSMDDNLEAGDLRSLEHAWNDIGEWRS